VDFADCVEAIYNGHWIGLSEAPFGLDLAVTLVRTCLKERGYLAFAVLLGSRFRAEALVRYPFFLV